jgi:hypothetical protein
MTGVSSLGGCYTRRKSTIVTAAIHSEEHLRLWHKITPDRSVRGGDN